MLVECLAAHLALFAREHPLIKIDLEERPSADTLEALQRKQADLGIIVSGGAMSGFHSIPYAKDQLVVAMPRDHRLAERKRLRFSELFDDDHIALERGTAVHRLLAEKSHAYGRLPTVRVQVRSFEVMCQMISQGLGIGILPRRATGPLVEALGLTLVALDEPWAERHFAICMQAREDLSAAARRLVDFLVAQPPVQTPRYAFASGEV